MQFQICHTTHTHLKLRTQIKMGEINNGIYGANILEIIILLICDLFHYFKITLTQKPKLHVLKQTGRFQLPNYFLMTSILLFQTIAEM